MPPFRPPVPVVEDPGCTKNWEKLTRALLEAMPPGAAIAWANTTPPSGFLLMDGSAIDADTDPALAALYGATLPTVTPYDGLNFIVKR